MHKICFFIGSRANYGRLKMVIDEAIRKGLYVEIILASQGIDVRTYQDNIVLSIDGLMYNDTHSNMVFTTSIVADHVSNYFAKHRPDVCIVHGDRYECLGFAIAASFNNCLLFHTEGGEITGSIDNKIRNAISALADVHFVPSVRAEMRLKKIHNPNTIYNVGSPAIDYIKSLDLRFPDDMPEYGLIVYHPNTTKLENIAGFITAVNKISEKIRLYWVAPNVDPGSKRILKELHRIDKITFLKNLSPEHFYTYMYNANFILGNTSAGIKEGGYMGVPYILIGDRQFIRDRGENVIHSTCDAAEIYTHASEYIRQIKRFEKTKLFGVGDASKKIVDITIDLLGGVKI